VITPPATAPDPQTTSMVRLRWLTIAIWLFWIFVYWGGGEKGVTDLRKAWSNKQSRLDLAAMSGITVFSISVIGSIVSKVLRRQLHSAPALGRTGTLVGMLLTGGGVAAMSISRSYMGQFWTTHATIHTEHEIIDHGPYGWVRHPIYTSALAIYIGTAMVFPSRSNILLAGLVCLSYALKAEAEELLLIEHIPGYAAYQGQVRSKLLPGLW
jgi:protein-S-isoprenylcysteine O-methyltransferase Ste14